MKTLSLLLFLVSFNLWASCPVGDSSRCYSCNKKIHEYESICGGASSWIKTTKVTHNEKYEQEIELVFLNKNGQVNIWFVEDDKCFTVSNKGREVSIPISQREDWENFRTKKPEVEIVNGCTSNVPENVCEDPLPPVTCVSEEIENSDGQKVCEQKYEEKAYAWEKVEYEVRKANGKNYCMKNNTFWVEVPPRPCHPCGYVPPTPSEGSYGYATGGNGSGEGYTSQEDPMNPAPNPIPENPNNNQNPTPIGDQIIAPQMRSLGISNV